MGQTGWLLSALGFIFFSGFAMACVPKPWGWIDLCVSLFLASPGLEILYFQLQPPRELLGYLTILVVLTHFAGRGFIWIARQDRHIRAQAGK